MKHRVAFRKLRRTSAHRWAMLRTMVSQLIEHGRIETTLPKAKELRRVADRCVTWGKEVRTRKLKLYLSFLAPNQSQHLIPPP